MTQLDLALEADVSARHLSFLETGRAQPSREMLLLLSRALDVPLRERNALLVAAGFAPMFEERCLDDAGLAAARRAIDVVLEAQRPFPAFALDRHWGMVATNGALPEIFEGVAAELLRAPINALRVSLHPRGLAPRIANLAQWRAHLIARLRRQIDLTGDPVLVGLLEEVFTYACGKDRAIGGEDSSPAVLVPLTIETSLGTLSLLSTTTVFGTPLDVTLSEIAIESFFPADARTAERVRRGAADASIPLEASG